MSLFIMTAQQLTDAMEQSKTRMTIEALLQSGALNTRNGSVTLHFDADGTLRKVETNQILFRT